MHSAENRFYEFGDFRLDGEERVLYRQGTPVPLTHKSLDLLLVLLESDGRILEREELLAAVWPGTSVDPSNLKKAVSSLRQALSDAGMAALTDLPLTSITIDDTQVGDPGLASLTRIPTLAHLSARKSKITDAGVDAARKALPKLKIMR